MDQKISLVSKAILAVPFCLLGGGVVALITQMTPSKTVETEISGYATSLKGRTVSQRLNAQRAAQSLDGRVISPGAEFSFNQVVKSWTFDQGYLKAPVSYDGELVRAYGGGVCQTSTTLYNAALMAGAIISERHSHVFAPHYVPPGRDAAVAQKTIDLRFRNPYPFPLRIRTYSREEVIDIRILGAERPKSKAWIETETLSEIEPQRLTRFRTQTRSSGKSYLRNPGATGYRVLTYRIFTENGVEKKRERVSDDTYEAMNRVIQVTEPN